MIGIILAGGFGTRMRPLTEHMPKPMLQVAGKPILQYSVELLREAKITDIVISLCYLPNVIRNYFGNGHKFGVNIHYTLEDQRVPMGNAGGVLLASDLIKRHDPTGLESFVVTYGDTIREIDVTTMVTQHRTTKATATLYTYKRFGADPKSLILFDKTNRISKFVERPNKTVREEQFVWSNGAFYVLQPQVLQAIPNNKPSDFGKDIFPKLLSKGANCYAYPSDGFFIDIGTKEKLQKAENYFRSS